jgi:pimeloyl-ACP methyl ester carboxylesterase
VKTYYFMKKPMYLQSCNHSQIPKTISWYKCLCDTASSALGKETRSMEHVISKDGTPIAYERSGAGPALVLVHGTTTDHTHWLPLLPKLERFFTVYTVDRRGRGQSGDTEPYAIQREFEDMVAVVDSISGTVGLLGHSYGALCCLEAALLTTNISKLALYEPPIYTHIKQSHPPEFLERITAYLKAGKPEEAVLVLYEIAQISPEELNMLRSLPSWSARVAAAHTIPREQTSVEHYAFNPDRFRNLNTPTLLLLGGESSPFYKAGTETLHASLPNSHIAVLSGQQHAAMVTEPELFLQEIINFFAATS